MKAAVLVLVLATSLFGPNAPATSFAQAGANHEFDFARATREARFDSWAAKLEPIEVSGGHGGPGEKIRLYSDSGEVDDAARARFERIAANEREPRVLAVRLEQLVFKSAYRFGRARVEVVSGWRERAGRHSSGEALDFKLQGVRAATVAAYLRGLARVGVGVYTHPRTQFVHLDVRDQSYHWLDASPPGTKWREMQLRDAKAAQRDEAWTPASDLPLYEEWCPTAGAPGRDGGSSSGPRCQP